MCIYSFLFIFFFYFVIVLYFNLILDICNTLIINSADGSVRVRKLMSTVYTRFDYYIVFLFLFPISLQNIHNTFAPLRHCFFRYFVVGVGAVPDVAVHVENV